MKQSIFFSLMLFLSAISFLSCDDYLDLDGFGGWYPSTNGEITKTPDREESYSIETFIVNGVSFNMILVEAGTFKMGNQSGEGNEKPVHSVTISEDFCIGETEVTQALWDAVTGYSPTTDGTDWSPAYGLGPDYPAYNINWDDCKKFIAKLNQLTGLQFRMPTEAEWEFAACGGNKSKSFVYSGSNTLADVAWFDENSWFEEHSYARCHHVKMKAPNELGIYDMSGNVWEWCSDWYGSYSSSTVTDPQGPATGLYRVTRGGCWNVRATVCRPTYRLGGSDPTLRATTGGFRLALSTKERTPDETPDEQEPLASKTFSAKGVSFNMIPVEHGTFIMGSESGLSDEKPVHSVTISKDFYIGETEVTQALWKAVTGHSPTSEGKAWSSANGLGNDFPAYYISWNDCQEFIAKLNELTEQKFRMPTEAEWEFAARGGKKSEGYIYSGSNNLDAVGWYDDNDAIFGPAFPDYGLHTVKSKLPNELGIYDMSGNVWEWCSDWYGTYSSSSVTDPAGPATGYILVIRGGCWDYDAAYCRTAKRNGSTPTNRSYNFGFRLALSPSK